jgi:hypothetical protein
LVEVPGLLRETVTYHDPPVRKADSAHHLSELMSGALGFESNDGFWRLH